MKIELHPSSQRGKNKIDWLDTKFSFSFANYFNPERMGFGALRVINDDTIAGGGGFATHSHDNMEIITIVMSGKLKHQDSMGNSGLIGKDEIQVMSAGSGIMHSEYNASANEPVKLFQIWIETKEQNIQPRYEQKNFADKIKANEIVTLVSGKAQADTLYIHQDAKISLAYLDKDKQVSYTLAKGNGLFAMNISGSIELAQHHLGERDAIAISETEKIIIKAQASAKILLIEVPLQTI